MTQQPISTMNFNHHSVILSTISTTSGETWIKPGCLRHASKNSVSAAVDKIYTVNSNCILQKTTMVPDSAANAPLDLWMSCPVTPWPYDVCGYTWCSSVHLTAQ
jgi:hypothetical protein